MRIVTLACGALLALALGTAAKAEDAVLKAVSFLPPNLNLSKEFITFTEKVNAAGAGATINYLGGPEVIPGGKQGQALERGVVDVVYTAMSRLAGSVPEGEALLGTNKSLADLRSSGALDTLNKMFEAKGLKILVVQHLGMHYNLYLVNEPTFKDGLPDLNGRKIRTSATYREFLEKLGASLVSVPSSEVYTALERGVAEGLAWPSVDIVSTGVGKIVKYRVDPGFFNAPNIVVVSLSAWDKLPEATRTKIEGVAHEFEDWSVTHTQELVDSEAKELSGLGVKFVEVPDSAKYEKLAFETVWARLKERNAESADKLRKLFYAE